MDPTIYKPSIYKGAGIYKTGDEGGGGECNSVEIFGTIYRCKLMPDGKIWLLDNLFYDDGEGDITFNSSNPVNGFYYTQTSALRISNKIEGWHLPSWAEFENLFQSSTVVALKSKCGWNDNSNGSDLYGFSAFPCGYNTTTGIGDYSYFWGSNNYGGTGRYAVIYKDNTSSILSDYTSKRCNVRLVKD